MTKIVVSLGKAGSIDVDTSKFSDQVQDYVFNYGLKQMLNDVHAGEKDLGLKPGLSLKKLDSLYAGEVAQARGGQGGDPVAKAMMELAEADVKAALRTKGVKLGTVAAGTMKEITIKQRDKREAHYRTEAEKIVALAKGAKQEVDIDLSDLGL